MGKRGGYHAVLLQVGAHMQTLSALPVQAPEAVETVSSVEFRKNLREEGAMLQSSALQIIQKSNDDTVNLDEIYKAMMIQVI